MNSAVRDIESKVQFWSLVGPLTIACILLIVILRSAATVTLPLVAVGGIFMCYKWKWPGLFAALGVLVLVFGLQFSLLISNDWLWFSILALSIASSFILTALSFDQSTHAFKAVEDQSERYKETINQLDDRLRSFQEKLQQERQEFHTHNEQLKREIEQHKDKILTSEKGAAFARDELAIQEEHQRHLLQELYASRQYAHQLEQQLATAFYPVGNMPYPVPETDPFDSPAAFAAQASDKSAEMAAKYEAEAASLRGMLEESEMRCRICVQELQQQTLELTHLKEIHDISNRSSAEAEEQQIVQQAVVQELNDHIENLTREKQLLESTLARLQAELEELVAKEEKDSLVLAGCHETIASLQSRLEASESVLKQETTKSQIQRASSEVRERDLTLQVEELTRKWGNVSQQIGDWQHKLEDYHQVCEKAAKFQQQINSLTAEKKRLELEAAELGLRLFELEKERQEAIEQSLQPVCDAKDDTSLLKSPRNDEPTPAGTDREMRRLSGLYNQLKEQFSEKSAVLDAARKELFCVQEQLNALQRDELESQVYGEDLVSKEMSRLLAASDEERSRLEEDYRHEIEQLYELVGTLSRVQCTSV